jgi:hypothetical protein
MRQAGMELNSLAPGRRTRSRSLGAFPRGRPGEIAGSWMYGYGAWLDAQVAGGSGRRQGLTGTKLR